MARFAPDRALLLLVARAEIDEAARRRLEQLVSGPVAWDALVGGARHHGVAPLLAERLQATGLSDALPGRVFAGLLAARDQVTAANLLYRDEFHEVASALMRANIQVILFKGLALAERLYDHLGQRPMIDLDLLVRPEDIPKADAVLSRLGYQSSHAAAAGAIRADFDAALWPSAEQRPKHRQFARRRAGMGCLLELHWTLEHAGSDDRLGDLWRRSQKAVVAGVACRQLGRDDEVVQLLAHFGLHGFGELIWLSDLDRLIRFSPALDWNSIGATARDAGLRLPSAATAHCLRSWFATPVPDVFGSPGPLRRAAMNRALVSDGAEPGVPNRYWLALCQWLNADGAWRRTVALGHWLFPSQATMAARHGAPPGRAAFRRATRPFRLARAIIASRGSRSPARGRSPDGPSQ